MIKASTKRRLIKKLTRLGIFAIVIGAVGLVAGGFLKTGRLTASVPWLPSDGKAVMYAMYTAAAVLVIGVLILAGIQAEKVLSRRRYSRCPLSALDWMDGIEFENYSAYILGLMGYAKCRVTKESRDFGADIICMRDVSRVVVQAKRYSGKVGIEAVQQVVASKAYYKASEAVIFTNSYLTSSAATLAKVNGVTVIDRARLGRFIMPSEQEEQSA